MLGPMCPLLYRLLVSLARLAVRSGRSKDLEIIVLRHQLAVLHRQKGRPALADEDRALLGAVAAALARVRSRRPRSVSAVLVRRFGTVKVVAAHARQRGSYMMLRDDEYRGNPVPAVGSGPWGRPDAQAGAGRGLCGLPPATSSFALGQASS